MTTKAEAFQPAVGILRQGGEFVASGILSQRIDEVPIAIVDLETTGLTPGADRVLEVAVVRVNPGEKPRLVLDSLVNPLRPVAATEIHGITDEDVAQAPPFREIAGDLVSALEDCVIAAYNVYFDIKFLDYELNQVGIDHPSPHFCLMYMRPLLGLGKRCRLEVACTEHDINYLTTHIAAFDAKACGELLEFYFNILRDNDISTFEELASLKKYKFIKSFIYDPLPGPSSFNLKCKGRFCSRSMEAIEEPVDHTKQALRSYWDALKTVVADLEITDDELEYINNERMRLGLKEEQIRVMHARAFASAIVQFRNDQWLDDEEAEKLNRLHQCLARMGWAPGN